jgi:hypothetical protein
MREDQLERALHASAPRVSNAGVLDRVEHKRARRRTRRRVEVGALGVMVVALLSLAVVLVRNDGETARVSAPGGRVITGGADVTPRAGTARPPVPIALDPDQGYVRGPLVLSGDTLSLAAYDHEGNTFRFPPSRTVRVDTRTFAELGRVDLKAEILSVADGEGARWVVTRNPKPPNGLPDAFLKRIGADGTVVSRLLPPGTDPVGDVTTGAGAVWIPVRDAVLRYDPVTMQLTQRYPLTAAETRTVVVTGGNEVVATDGGDLVALRPDGVVSGLCACTATGDPIVGLASSSSGELLKLARNPTTGATHLGDERLPRGFSPTRLSRSGGRVWVEGTVSGAPAVVLIGDTGSVRSTVVLDDAHDASFAWVRPDTLLVVSNGQLLRIDVAL